MDTSIFYLMHGNRKVARIGKNGKCKVYYKTFMPYDLYFEESENFDDLIDNINNFYYWCASRVLTLDRQYAKEILNSIGATQSTTDKDRAEIALSYHCLSLADIFWVKYKDEKIEFDSINLYQNHLKKSFIDVSLRGKQMTIQNSYLIADDMSTNGCFPKAWIREDDGFSLLKDGGIEFVENEILASRICQCFDCNQVIYNEYTFDGQKVSESKIITSLEYGTVSKRAFEVYAQNKGIDHMEYILKLDAHGYYMMNILDYLIGNTDRHWENWGLLIDNKTNKPVRLYDLMDFNKAFSEYDTEDGTGSLTERGKSQKEAAITAVKQIGLNQIKEINPKWFDGNSERLEMFNRRLNILKNIGV